METTHTNWSQLLRFNLRVIVAIAAKDILDALRNKTTISIILGVAITALNAQALPLLLKLSGTLRVAVYDQGKSRLVSELKTTPGMQLYRWDSFQQMEDFVGEGNGLTLGLVLPANLDAALESGDAIILDGYHVHWISGSELAKARRSLEARLSELSGGAVRINTHAVYPGVDTIGRPFMTSLSFVIAVLIICTILVPYLLIEEKEARTMDVLLVSPASSAQVVAGKALAGSIYGLAAAGVLLLFNRSMIVHWGTALLATLAGTLLAVAVGLLLGSLFEKADGLGLWAGIALLVFFVPIFLTSGLLAGPSGLLRDLLAWFPTISLFKLYMISFAGEAPPALVASNLGLVLSSALLLYGLVIWRVRQIDR